MKKLLAVAATLALGLAASAQDKAELEFLKTGPRLYPMDKALELTADTGKPTACWVGKHLFADPRARKLSADLGKTTIQAAMDTADNWDEPRVKFTSNNYAGAKPEVRYVLLKDMDKPGMAEAILKFCRGGK